MKPQLLSEDLQLVERYIYQMGFAELRASLRELLELETWPGDGQVLLQLLTEYPIHVERDDFLKITRVSLDGVRWTHRDTMAGVFRAYLYYAVCKIPPEADSDL